MNIKDLLKNKYEFKGKIFTNQIIDYQNIYKSLMTINQLEFLMSLIYENKLKYVLEIGVYNGVSSLCMLKAGLKGNRDFELYSFDINADINFYGKAVMESCTDEEKKHYNLFLKSTSFDIDNIIQNNIKFDLVFIDAKHSHPGPLIDLLFIIPYLNDNALVCLHDVVDHYIPNDFGASYIFEIWNDNYKYRVYDYENKVFSSMGIIQIPYDKNILLENLIAISKISFQVDPYNAYFYNSKNMKYCLGIDINDINKLKTYIMKNYNNEIFANQIFDIFMKNYNNYMDNFIYNICNTRGQLFLYKNIEKINDFYIKYNNFIEAISWWIPIKKLRERFRNAYECRPDQTRPDQNEAT